MDGIFGGNISYLEKGLDAAWLRNSVIANNIANADTPNFKSSSVEFESLFRSALDGLDQKAGQSPDGLTESALNDVEPIVVQNGNTSMRMDGNNVDIDYENAQMATNAIYYETLVEKISSEFAQLRTAINGGV